MIIYRPHKGSLFDSMKERKEFRTEYEMMQYIVAQWKGQLSITDIVIKKESTNDERIGWKDSAYVCAKRLGAEKYDVPQCIGICATNYDQSVYNEKQRTDWVESWITKFPGSRSDVLTFISKIVWYSINIDEADAIYNLFTAGYCYYFAKMLEDAFGGEVCWHKDYSHIVWRDENKICYDIGGIFYDCDEGDIVPISELGDELETFRHRTCENKPKKIIAIENENNDKNMVVCHHGISREDGMYYIRNKSIHTTLDGSKVCKICGRVFNKDSKLSEMYNNSSTSTT